MGAETCQRCGSTSYDGPVRACAFCNVAGCTDCLLRADGDPMYSDPICCKEAEEMSGIWWSMPREQQERFPAGVAADDMSRAEALALLERMRRAGETDEERDELLRATAADEAHDAAREDDMERLWL